MAARVVSDWGRTGPYLVIVWLPNLPSGAYLPDRYPTLEEAMRAAEAWAGKRTTGGIPTDPLQLAYLLS